MNPSSPQNAPVMLGASHRVTGGPPSEETFLIAPLEEKPTQRQSPARGLGAIGRVFSRPAQMFLFEAILSPRSSLSRGSPARQRRPLACHPARLPPRFHDDSLLRDAPAPPK